MIPVNEVFLTIQGEATWTGTPAVFVRTQGCKVGCAFCDTKHTWPLVDDDVVSVDRMLAKRDDTPKYALMAEPELVALVVGAARGARHVVLTGGEPCDHVLAPLCDRLRGAGFTTQIETSGTADVFDGGLAYVTLSPKIDQAGGLPVLRRVVERADEIKHPVATMTHLQALLRLLSERWHRPGIPVWLQPLSQSPSATARCVEWCKEYGFRLSLQTHKYAGLR